MHARRKFVDIDAVKVNGNDVSAVQMVMRIDELFLVDRDARQKQMTVEERLAACCQHAEEWAEEIQQECVNLATNVLPKSALGKAISYTLNMWPKLRQVFDYAEVELSNNRAENSMRPVALGRKNWLHGGSAKAGPKVAAILSVVGILPPTACATAGESARRSARPPRPRALRRHPANPGELVGGAR